MSKRLMGRRSPHSTRINPSHNGRAFMLGNPENYRFAATAFAMKLDSQPMPAFAWIERIFRVRIDHNPPISHRSFYAGSRIFFSVVRHNLSVCEGVRATTGAKQGIHIANHAGRCDRVTQSHSFFLCVFAAILFDKHRPIHSQNIERRVGIPCSKATDYTGVVPNGTVELPELQEGGNQGAFGKAFASARNYLSGLEKVGLFQNKSSIVAVAGIRNSIPKTLDFVDA